MTLREEISLILSEYIPDECPNKEVPVDEILSKIEKRIDDELHELEMRTYDLEDLGEDDATNETLSEYKVWKKVKEVLK